MRPGLYVRANPLRLVCVDIDDKGQTISLEYPLPSDAAIALSYLLQAEALKAAGSATAVVLAASEQTSKPKGVAVQ